MEMLMKKQRVDKKAFDSNFTAGLIDDSSIDINSHRKNVRTEKLQRKGKSTTNPHEKDAFLKRTGPQLPFAKKKSRKTYG